MATYLVLVFGLLLTQKTMASSQGGLLVHSEKALCEGLNKKGFFQKRLREEQGNRLAFRNLPGPAERGLCWWHSRLTRSALYLAVFRPDQEQKPDADQVEEILNHLMDRDQVVEIPGYSNLWDFSKDHLPEIESALSGWSLWDTLNLNIRNAFIGNIWEKPQRLSQLMDKLYHEVKVNGRVVFQTLQLPGISAHSWLVVDMDPTPKGYQFKVVDSNYLDVQVWEYERGQTQFNYSFTEFLPVEGRFVPYINRDWYDEETQIISVLKSRCQNGSQDALTSH